MTDQISVCVVVDLEANGDTFGGGGAIYIVYVRNAATDGKVSYDRSPSIIEMRSDLQRLSFLRWGECPLHEKAFGVR